MWTHADKMWTDADCPQKCGQMRTINADSTETRSMQRAMVYGMVQNYTVWYTSNLVSERDILRRLTPIGQSRSGPDITTRPDLAKS